ncbi:hypothetical protein [Nonomuraea africana]|uniref:GAF domain-containing protein n=1 Tax=Nonomuraea africana TaxID=46171 RepID=A0ABR9KF56_9ACTN|nr:hypothetical protein [Nonomuraea africana]MBE1560648.1 GAF domain-containing protein [Nonomuraea africana]
MTSDCVKELIESFSRTEADDLLGQVVRCAAAVGGTSYAGFAEVDPLQELACLTHALIPRDDRLGVRAWLEESGTLKELATGSDPVLVAKDPSLGAPGFLAVPVPLATRDLVYLWVAGGRFTDREEHLLGRLALACGRALEASRGLEAAARMLRSVHAFTA